VSSGVVHVLSILNGESTEVNEDESVTVEIGKPLEIESFEKDEWVLLNEQKDEEFFSDSKLLEKVKEDLYDRLEPYRDDIMNIYRVTDEEFDVLIDGYLLGYFDLPPDTPDWIRDIIELT
jgi:hypothetical protein